MIELNFDELAAAAGGSAQRGPVAEPHLRRAVIDSREATTGDLFFAIKGEHADGADFALGALAAGAWGVVVAESRFGEIAEQAGAQGLAGHVFAADSPTIALGAVATAWRRRLGAKVIGVTGSTGKTSTKDILAALVGKSHVVAATPANRNTEIGMPLAILAAAPGTEVLVLEMAMRGRGQIDELARIAEPDVGCVVNVGPVHLELLGSVENVAAAKAELIAALGERATAVLPADEPLLAPHLRSDIASVTFGAGGDVRLTGENQAGELEIDTPLGGVRIKPSFTEQYLTRNLLAAVACAQAIGAPVGGELIVNFSALRGEVSEVLGGVTLINDCYNANPVSMRAALDNLAAAKGRRIAVLGGMGELGVDSDRFHHEIAKHAAASGVDFLIAVGELAGAYGDNYAAAIEHVATPEAAAHILRQRANPGDTVLVKGSRSVGLERVGELLVGGVAAGEAEGAAS